MPSKPRQNRRRLSLRRAGGAVAATIGVIAALAQVDLWREEKARPEPTAQTTTVPTPRLAVAAATLGYAGTVETSEVELDDSEIVTKGTASSATLDITVRNDGDTVGILTEARLVIRRSALLDKCPATGDAVSTTGHYQLTLPDHASTLRQTSVTIHQAVPPRSADRFALTIGGTEDVYTGDSTIVLADLELDHDADVEPVRVAGIVIAAKEPSMEEFFGMPRSFLPDDDPLVQQARGCAAANRRIAQSFVESGRLIARNLVAAANLDKTSKPPDSADVRCDLGLARDHDFDIGPDPISDFDSDGYVEFIAAARCVDRDFRIGTFFADQLHVLVYKGAPAPEPAALLQVIELQTDAAVGRSTYEVTPDTLSVAAEVFAPHGERLSQQWVWTAGRFQPRAVEADSSQ